MSYHRTSEWTGTPIGGAGRLRQLMRDVVAGLDALTRVQFDRPWERKPQGRR